MASSPITGGRPTGFRRSSSQFATLPQRSLTTHEQAALSKEDASADTLFSHPNVKIYQFKPPTDALESLDKTKKTLPDADYPIDAIEILPWRSRTETLVAKGKLIIEKVQGSVHFMKAGFSFVHTILRNSQCWCVDGESKFVLRIGNLRYARIEFPNAEPEDNAKVEEFKEVLAKIMRFEKTPCPFIRAIKIDLPDDAITPRRRGTWKRKESMTPVTPDTESPVSRKPTRTMSMRGMPPSSFPARSMTSVDTDRPRNASTPIGGQSSFRDLRTDSPASYASSDSERHDSEDDKPESGYHSEVESSDKEDPSVPTIRSPLKNVLTMPIDEDSEQLDRATFSTRPNLAGARRSSTVESQVKLFEGYKVVDEPLRKQSPASRLVSRTSSELDTSPRTTANDLSSFTDDAASVPTVQGIPQKKHEPSATTHDLDHAVTQLTIDEISSDQLKGSGSPTLKVVQPGSPLPTDQHEVGKLREAAVEQSLARDRLPRVKSPTRRNTKPNPSPRTTVDEFGGLEIETDDELYRRLKDETRRPVRPLQEALQEIGYELGLSPKTTQSKIQFVPTTKLETEDDHAFEVGPQSNDDTESIVSTDSFHTLLSDHDDDASGEWPAALLSTRPFQHRRELSEMTVRAPIALDVVQQNDQETSYLVTDAVDVKSQSSVIDENFAPPGAFIETSELRQRLRHRRSLSPLPPTSILRTSSEPERSPISKLLVQKAAALAVVKPVEIVLLVVHILARIAGGATMNDLVSGELFRRPGGPRRTASGTFEGSRPSRGRHTDRDASDSDDMDDYGHHVANRRGSVKPLKPRNGSMFEKDEHALPDGSVD